MATAVDLWSLFTKVKIVGAGGSGQAVLVKRTAIDATHLASQGKTDRTVAGHLYVVKRIFLQGETSQKTMQAAAIEVKVLQSIEEHPNVVCYYDHFVDSEGYLDIVMEYCRGGDLDRFLAERRRKVQDLLSEAKSKLSGAHADDALAYISVKKEIEEYLLGLEDVLYLAFQLLLAVGHLHTSGVMHRDLKPANVFLQPLADGELEEEGFPPLGNGNGVAVSNSELPNVKKYRLKVADFGIAHVMQNTVSFAQTVIGTPYYIAPEIAESKPYTTSADIWAAGCIVFEMCSLGIRCFEGDNMLAVVTKITSGKIRTFPEVLRTSVLKPLLPEGATEHISPPQELFDDFKLGERHAGKMEEFVAPLIRAMIRLDPEQRSSAEALIEEFFLPEVGCTDFVDDFEDPQDYE